MLRWSKYLPDKGKSKKTNMKRTLLLITCMLVSLTMTPQVAYRPFVEDGKIWKVGGKDSGNPVKYVAYYYFDGDTIINNKTFKRMMCQRYVNPEYPDYTIVMHYPLLRYVGAWYEEDQKVYFATNNQVKLLYDFSLNANDTIVISGNSTP